MSEYEVTLADIEGKVALVTGASSGLGKEFCLCLAKKGCHVIAAARRTTLLESLLEEIKGLPVTGGGRQVNIGKAAAIPIDVSANESDIAAAIDKAWHVFGRIDVLVNNAGFRGSVKTPLDFDEEEWSKVLATNLRGSWLVSKAVVQHMKAADIGGSIINISSISGLERGLLPGAMVYATSKAALNHLTKGMALEFGVHNVRVNAIAAGLFRSDITSKLFEKDWFNNSARKITPMQRWGATDPDLTSLLILLSSNATQYITGCIFVVDGGQSIPGIPLWSSL